MSRRAALPRLYAHKHHTCARRAGGGMNARHADAIATFALVTMAIFNPLSTVAVYGLNAETARDA